MSTQRSSSRIRGGKAAVMLWLAAAFMAVLGVLSGAQSALASTAGIAQVGSHGTAMSAGSRVGGAEPAATNDIHEHSCDSSTRNWVHIKFSSSEKCYGGVGDMYFQANDLESFCPGNNNGHFEWMDAKGNDHGFNFAAGGATVHFPFEADALELDITSHEGDASC